MKDNQGAFHSDKLFVWLITGLWAITFACLAYTAGLIYFFNWYQRPSVQWTTTTFPLVQNMLRQGDPIQATVKRCSKDTYSADVTRVVVDGVSIPVTENPPLLFLKGCVTETRELNGVTKTLQAGTYYLLNHVEVHVRWLIYSRVDVYETRTEDFTIIDEKGI